MRPGHIASKLDRFLVQDSFLLLGLNSSSKIFPFGGYDHKAYLLEMRNDQNLGPIPFRFSPLWVSHKDFLGIVADAWSVPVTGSSFFVWEEKLRRVKKVLKSWEKSIDTPNQKKVQVALKLESHQIDIESKQIVEEDLKK